LAPTTTIRSATPITALENAGCISNESHLTPY
jgi:hypothetical protein